MGIKMIDIAREAGVSTATVGRVLHRRGYVSEDARVRVEAAVKKFNYVPNAMARALTRQRSGVIGCLVVENQGNLYQRINSSILSAAERRGFQLVMLQGRDRHRDEERLLNQFIGMRVDGLAIVTNVYMTGPLFERLRSLSIPTVMVERTYDEPCVDNIIIRDQEGFYDATRRFLQKGHRRIAFLGYEMDSQVETMRREGFQRAMEEAGVPRDQQLVRLLRSYSEVEGRRAMEALLALSDPPTGVVCGADLLAAGAMQALYQAGMRVPEDVSIVGHDDVLAARLAPPIDSLVPDLEQVGELVMSLLERRMAEPDSSARTEYLDTLYVDRGSIGRGPYR